MSKENYIIRSYNIGNPPNQERWKIIIPMALKGFWKTEI